MINDFDLTPKERRLKYPEEVIKKADTFKTNSVSKQERSTGLLRNFRRKTVSSKTA